MLTEAVLGFGKTDEHKFDFIDAMEFLCKCSIAKILITNNQDEAAEIVAARLENAKSSDFDNKLLV